MSRDGDPQRAAEQTIDRIAHAFSPTEWKGRSLAAVIVAFATIASLTVVQRALLAEGVTGWVITAIHGVIVVIVVPLLARRAVREWRAAQSPQPSGVPE